MIQYVNFLSMMVFAQHVALVNAHKLLEDDQQALSTACATIEVMKEFIQCETKSLS